MTTAVASQAESRTAQRFKTLSEIASLARGLTYAQVSGDLPPVLSERLSAFRYRARLEQRFLRRAGIGESPAELLKGLAPKIAGLGESGLRDVIVDTGAICQYAILRRTVDQSILAELSGHLGLDVIGHDARTAMRGASIDLARSLASPAPAFENDAEAIVNAILQDGLQCWTCWIHSQPPVLQRFLCALSPEMSQGGTDIAVGECRPRACRHRADLFAARLDMALTDRDETTGDGL